MTISTELSGAFRLMALICAFLVIGIHMPYQGGIVDAVFANGICRIAVPFFFFASGFFIGGKVDDIGWWYNAVRGRVRTLLLPFFVWSIVSMLLPYLYGGQARVCSIGELFDFFGLNPFTYPGVVPYWYIRTLFLMCLMSWFFVRICAVTPRLWILFLTIAWLVVCPWHDVFPIGFPPLRRLLPVDAMLFFNVGICFRIYHLEHLFSAKNALLILPLGMAFMALKIGFSMDGVGYAWIFGSVSVPLMIFGMLGVLAFVKNDFAFSRYAFPVYMVLSLLLLVWRNLLDKFNQGENWYLLLYLVTFLSCILFADATRRLFPKCYNVIFGGR